MIIREYKEPYEGDVLFINNQCHEKAQPDADLLEVINSPKAKTWVAVDYDGDTVGFIIGTIKHGMPYIYNVAVLSESQGKGIGKSLIETFEKHFETTRGDYWLQVNKNNPAQKLYFDFGYRVESVDDNFYGNEQHAVCMVKHSR